MSLLTRWRTTPPELKLPISSRKSFLPSKPLRTPRIGCESSRGLGRTLVVAPLIRADPAIVENFPRYLYEETTITLPLAQSCLLSAIQLIFECAIRFTLRPLSKAKSATGRDHVNAVYSARAEKYDEQHHITTRGQDTQWRRLAGEVVVELLRKDRARPLRILDLCTGTGLVAAEIDNVVNANAKGSSCVVEIVGVDNNTEMLRLTRKRQFRSVSATFCRADARSLVLRTLNSNTSASESSQFLPGSFDFITQIFGIGAIGQSTEVFKNVLELLAEGGQFLLVDMHRPIPSLPGEMPVGTRFFPTAPLEAFFFQRTTVPLVLERVWAWRDTTLDLYIAPLVTLSQHYNFWGFEVLLRHYEPERWWSALPVMPTMRLLLRKVSISKKEFQRRQELLQALLLAIPALHNDPLITTPTDV